MLVQEKLALLRQQMQQHQLDAYIVPSADPHQSEYLPEHWKTREWLSGFTGSAGTLVVTADFAGLWTDGRYFLQAEQELTGSGIALQKQQVSHAPEHIEWLCNRLKSGQRLGLDGTLFSVRQAEAIERKMTAKGIAVDVQADLIRPIWSNRPPLPEDPIFEHNIYFAGAGRQDKLDTIRAATRAQGADYLLACALDDIAWALNLRGSDVECNPVFIAYLLIGKDTAELFLPLQKCSDTLRKQLEKDGVQLRPYDAIGRTLQALPANASVLADPSATSIALFESLRHTQLIYGANPIRDQKALKNPVEIRHIRQAMRHDGIALTRLFMWLEDQLQQGVPISEYQLAEQLKYFRAQHPDYRGESFPAIVGYNANGAIIHYRPQQDTSATIRKEGILLLDSGGQYLHGTTDITRTVALGAPTEAQKNHFTLVLKGYIALASAHFPKGTTGVQLDTLARYPLWKEGLNYNHGTGHGVGFFLSVHEAPQGFANSAVTSRGATPLAEGHLTSNEPGFYLEGQYGIRTENLEWCIPSPKSAGSEFLCFETLSLFPIDRTLIQESMLTREECAWLNDYHTKVFDELAPLLNEKEQEWLENAAFTAFSNERRA